MLWLTTHEASLDGVRRETRMNEQKVWKRRTVSRLWKRFSTTETQYSCAAIAGVASPGPLASRRSMPARA